MSYFPIKVSAEPEFCVPLLRREWNPMNAGPDFDRYGGKSILDLNGRPAFAEHLTVHELLHTGAKWAFWSDNFRRRFSIEPGQYFGYSDLSDDSRIVWDELVKINGGRRGGIWDVIGHDASGTIIIRECKLLGKDRIRPSQALFAKHVRESGLDARLEIVEWTLG